MFAILLYFTFSVFLLSDNKFFDGSTDNKPIRSLYYWYFLIACYMLQALEVQSHKAYCNLQYKFANNFLILITELIVTQFHKE